MFYNKATQRKVFFKINLLNEVKKEREREKNALRAAVELE